MAKKTVDYSKILHIKLAVPKKKYSPIPNERHGPPVAMTDLELC
jgi:hypothetical protein